MNICCTAKATIISLLFMAVVQSAYALENTQTYATGYSAESTSSKIYKTVDVTGKVSYSQIKPQNSISLKEMILAPAPLQQNVVDNKARLDRIRETAVQLAEAREKREARREDEETKRLQRLALIRTARQPPYERKVYISYPLRWIYPHPHRHQPLHHSKHHRNHYPGVARHIPRKDPHLPLTSGLSFR